MGLWALEFDYREIMTVGVRKWMEDEWMTESFGTILPFSMLFSFIGTIPN